MLAALCLLATSTGFAQQAPVSRTNTMQPVCEALPTAVVLDFSLSPRVVESREYCTRRLGFDAKDVVTEKDRRGWWLSRQDLYFNGNAGIMAADIFNDTFREKCVFRVASRGDLKKYYADKRELLNDKFSLSSEQLRKALVQLDPISIGREMGVDKVVVAHICDSELRKAVMPGSFASAISMNVAIFDVATGRLEFDRCYQEVKRKTTTYFHYEALAAQVTKEILNHRISGRVYYY